MENRSQRDWAISLEKEAANFQGRAGIFLYGLDSGIQFSYQGGRCFPAASLIKIPLFLAAAELTEDVEWNRPMTVTRENRVGGTGILARMKESYSPLWQELLFLSIAESDNTAANQILDCIGGYCPVRDWLVRHHIRHTKIERKMRETEAGQEGRENWTTASDMGKILSDAVLHASQAGPEGMAGRKLLEAMGKQQYRNKLPALIPTENPPPPEGRPSPGHAVIWNKTGDLGRIQHDAGLFLLPTGHRYILVICTEHEKDGQEGIRWIADISCRIWRIMTDEESDRSGRFAV
jgi:beta-lactamase class A